MTWDSYLNTDAVEVASSFRLAERAVSPYQSKRYPMTHIQLKMVDEGQCPDRDKLMVSLRYHLGQDGIYFDDDAHVQLKIKFISEPEKEQVLLQLRDSSSKEKLGEKVLPFIADRWLADVTNESHALVAILIPERA